jgi:hypothetical protein
MTNGDKRDGEGAARSTGTLPNGDFWSADARWPAGDRGAADRGPAGDFSLDGQYWPAGEDYWPARAMGWRRLGDPQGGQA